MEENNITLSDYTIPKDIKDRIPDYFYIAMAGELFSVHGWKRGVYMLKESCALIKEGDYYLDTSTGGWQQALKMTCRKLDMMWLYEYWMTLEWYDSDIFDAEIEREIIDKFIKSRSDVHANSYYKYLCELPTS